MSPRPIVITLQISNGTAEKRKTFILPLPVDLFEFTNSLRDYIENAMLEIRKEDDHDASTKLI